MDVIEFQRKLQAGVGSGELDKSSLRVLGYGPGAVTVAFDFLNPVIPGGNTFLQDGIAWIDKPWHGRPTATRQAPRASGEPLYRTTCSWRVKGAASSRLKSLDVSKLDPVVRKALEDAPAAGRQLMVWKVPTIARVVNGWSMNTDTMGVYGNYYLKRAIVAQLGLGANLPEDAIYPLNLADENGKPLDGASKYTIHFDKGATPPVNAFWSVTLYDSDGFQVANSLNRFAVSSWMPFKYNPDGSLDLYFQNESPGTDKEVNWLPAPKGPFNLTMRLYAPKSDALTGKWNPPPIAKLQGASNLMAQ